MKLRIRFFKVHITLFITVHKYLLFNIIILFVIQRTYLEWKNKWIPFEDNDLSAWSVRSSFDGYSGNGDGAAVFVTDVENGD